MKYIIDEKSKFFCEMGMKSCSEGEFEKGLKSFNTGLEIDEDNILLLYNKAVCLMNMGETDKANSIFERTIKLCDKFGKGEFVLGIKANSYIFLKDYKSAKGVLEDLLKVSPNNVNALINMAQMFNKEFDYEGALPYFDRALEIDPNNPDALMFKGETLYHLFRYDEARQYFDRSFAISKESPYIWYLKGLCESHFENHETAVEYYKRAIEIDPDFEKCLFDMSLSLTILGRAEEAKDAFHKMFDLHPENYDEKSREVADEIVDMLSSHFSKD